LLASGERITRHGPAPQEVEQPYSYPSRRPWAAYRLRLAYRA